MHLITCIGDVHVGHPAAVWPKGYETDKGNPIGQNKAQEKLWQYWTEFWNHPLVRESEIERLGRRAEKTDPDRPAAD